MSTTLIQNARAIVTCDAQDHVYWDADILIDGPKIVKIGPHLTDPCDEVIDAMRAVGDALPASLRETGGGGLAATPTGRRIAEQM